MLKKCVVLLAALAALQACVPSATPVPPTVPLRATAVARPTSPSAPSATSAPAKPTSSVTAAPTQTLSPTLGVTEPPPPDITLVRWPYVQSVMTDSAVIVWTTTQAGPSEVRYAAAGEAERVASAASREDITPAPPPYDRYFVHEAQLTGLTPATEYAYRIYTAGADLWPEGVSPSFRTAPASGDLAFIVFGDSGTGSAAQYALRDRMAVTPFDFALVAGDTVYPDGTYEQFERYFFGVYAELLARRPFWLAPGNHDYRTDQAAPFLDVFVLPQNAASPEDRGRYYSFDWGNAHIVALDAYAPFVGNTMVDWLAADLSATQKPWKFVFLHPPAYSSGPHGGDAAVHDRLVPIFEQQGVDIVFSGHDHDYERTVPILRDQAATTADGGVVYVVSGGGGAPLYGVTPQWFTAYARSVHAFAYVKVTGCVATIEAITADGTVLDTGTVGHCP